MQFLQQFIIANISFYKLGIIFVKYITQINTRPTAFKIFSNSDSIPENYMQYLQNSISKEFELYGFAVRIFYSVSNNPYHKKRK